MLFVTANNTFEKAMKHAQEMQLIPCERLLIKVRNALSRPRSVSSARSNFGHFLINFNKF